MAENSDTRGSNKPKESANRASKQKQRNGDDEQTSVEIGIGDGSKRSGDILALESTDTKQTTEKENDHEQK